MATQNSTITVRGKLGNIVGYKGRDGKRLARIRQTEVKNPKTDGQVIQRMILATASKAYGRMKSICDHSFQGVSYGAPSQSYFLKRAILDIRYFVAKTLPEFPETLRKDPRAFIGLAEPKSLANAGVGLLISEGTIPAIPVTLNTPEEGAETVVDYFGNLISSEGARPSVIKVMNALGAQKGDQITVAGLLGNGSFTRTRYVIKANATEDELDAEWESEAAVFDEVKTIIGDVYLNFKNGASANQRKVYVSASKDEVIAAAIIISRKVGDVWQRSTQRLVWLSDAGDFSPNFADNVLKMWKAGTTEISTENPYYLNNADV